MGGRGFSSDVLRDIFRAAVKQGWISQGQRKSGHAYISCPQCGYQEAFSLTGRGYAHETKAKVSSLRKHGFVWKGRGGTHTAPLPVPGPVTPGVR